MTKGMLFVDPIAAVFMAFAAYVGRNGSPWWIAFDVVCAVGFVAFWLLLLNAYTERVSAEARLDQATRDAAIAGRL